MMGRPPTIVFPVPVAAVRRLRDEAGYLEKVASSIKCVEPHPHCDECGKRFHRDTGMITPERKLCPTCNS